MDDEPNQFTMTIKTTNGETLVIKGTILEMDVRPASALSANWRVTKCIELMAKYEARGDRQSRYKLRTWRANYLAKRLSQSSFEAKLKLMEAKLELDNKADDNMLEKQLRGSLAVTRKVTKGKSNAK